MQLWFGNITVQSVHAPSFFNAIDWTLDATQCNHLFADNECEEACVHGLCGDACQTTSDCADGNQCQKNECIMPCTDRLSCPPLQICVQGYCTTNCKACSTTLSTNLALTHIQWEHIKSYSKIDKFLTYFSFGYPHLANSKIKKMLYMRNKFNSSIEDVTDFVLYRHLVNYY